MMKHFSMNTIPFPLRSSWPMFFRVSQVVLASHTLFDMLKPTSGLEIFPLMSQHLQSHSFEVTAPVQRVTYTCFCSRH